jgi:hypothetical protein
MTRNWIHSYSKVRFAQSNVCFAPFAAHLDCIAFILFDTVLRAHDVHPATKMDSSVRDTTGKRKRAHRLPHQVLAGERAAQRQCRLQQQKQQFTCASSVPQPLTPDVVHCADGAGAAFETSSVDIETSDTTIDVGMTCAQGDGDIIEVSDDDSDADADLSRVEEYSETIEVSDDDSEQELDLELELEQERKLVDGTTEGSDTESDGDAADSDATMGWKSEVEGKCDSDSDGAYDSDSTIVGQHSDDDHDHDDDDDDDDFVPLEFL